MLPGSRGHRAAEVAGVKIDGCGGGATPAERLEVEDARKAGRGLARLVSKADCAGFPGARAASTATGQPVEYLQASLRRASANGPEGCRPPVDMARRHGVRGALGFCRGLFCIFGRLVKFRRRPRSNGPQDVAAARGAPLKRRASSASSVVPSSEIASSNSRLASWNNPP
jgi:hypothetical protein